MIWSGRESPRSRAQAVKRSKVRRRVAMVRAEAPLTAADVAGVERLDEAGITDLTGIAQLTSLRSLSVTGSGLTELTGLAGAPSLTYLNASGNAITAAAAARMKAAC